MGRLGMVASAVAFARSERGQRMIAEARRRYDTPENRAKVAQAVASMRNRSAGGTNRSR